jgi:hypothetical protein
LSNEATTNSFRRMGAVKLRLVLVDEFVGHGGVS